MYSVIVFVVANKNDDYISEKNIVHGPLYILVKNLFYGHLLCLHASQTNVTSVLLSWIVFGLNVFHSGIKYSEKDSLGLKVRHYPLQGWIYKVPLH